MSESWKENNRWEYLDILNTLFKMWIGKLSYEKFMHQLKIYTFIFLLDCGRLENTFTIVQELQKVHYFVDK